MNNRQEKDRKCPWCLEIVEKPKIALLKKEHGDVIERRCPHCGKILAAYLEQEGEFMRKMRSY